MSEQRKSRPAHQARHAESERTGSQMPVQHQGQTSQPTDRKLSGHTPSVSSEQIGSEQTDHTKSGQDNRRSSEPTDRKNSSQYDRKAAEPNGQDGRRSSAPMPHRASGPADQVPYELIDSRKFGLVEPKSDLVEQVEHILSDPMGFKTSAKTHHKTHNQIIELAEEQKAEHQVISAVNPRVIRSLYTEYEKVEDEDDIDDDQTDLGESDESDDRKHTSKKGKETEFKLKELRYSKIPDITNYENDIFMKAFKAYDSKLVGSLQTKDHNFVPRFPAISTKFDYLTNQEKGPIIVTMPVG
uniref:Uncharacterized protein n=1 Tax=Pipistrellus kuhlii TaxID=59472 RepID=A0A7J8A8A7_PIPKU|nr:hypothetical protein mPipKuh1_008867 [Pipistrellus kuhlii]